MKHAPRSSRAITKRDARFSVHRARGRGAAPQEGKVPGRPRQRLTEPVRARIAELHGAGRTVSAISKELGVPYGTVRTHVKARGARAPA